MMVGGVVGSNAKHPISAQNLTRLNSLGITYKNGVFTKETTVEVQLQEEQGAIAVGIPIVVKFTVEVALPALIILTNTLTMEQTLNSAISSSSTSISDIARECFDVDIKELAEMQARTSSGDIASQLGNIAGKYGYKDIDEYGFGKCEIAANKMVAYLKKMKKNGAVITLTWTPAKRAMVYSDGKEKLASENGLHVGVLYEGKVFCNVWPEGKTKQAWINDFVAPPYVTKNPPVEIPF